MTALKAGLRDESTRPPSRNSSSTLTAVRSRSSLYMTSCRRKAQMQKVAAHMFIASDTASRAGHVFRSTTTPAMVSWYHLPSLPELKYSNEHYSRQYHVQGLLPYTCAFWQCQLTRSCHNILTPSNACSSVARPSRLCPKASRYRCCLLRPLQSSMSSTPTLPISALYAPIRIRYIVRFLNRRACFRRPR